MSYISSRVKEMTGYFNHEAKYVGKQKQNPFHKTRNPQVGQNELPSRLMI